MRWLGVAIALFGLGCGATVVVDAEPSGSTAAAAGAGGGDMLRCDVDGDGFVAVSCGGDDCNDDDPAIHPGALDDAPGSWRSDVVATDGDTGWSTSVAVDDLGVVHVSFVELDTFEVRYGRRDGATWTFERIGIAGYATGGMSMTSLALDAERRPHIVYPDATWQLQLAVRDDDGWSAEPIDDGVEAATIAIAAGTVHVAYVLQVGGIRHATRSDDSWAITSVDSDAAYFAPALAIDAASIPHLAYPAGWQVRYATRVGDAWQTIVVEDISGVLRVAIASVGGGVGTGAAPVLSYGSSSEDGGMRFASLVDGAFHIDTIDDRSQSGVNSALAIGRDGDVHVAYFTKGELSYARRRGVVWETTSVREEKWTGAHVALAIEDAGVAHLASRGSDDQWSDNDLHYATNRAPANGIDDDCDGHEW